jgi:hypothetical protein
VPSELPGDQGHHAWIPIAIAFARVDLVILAVGGSVLRLPRLPAWDLGLGAGFSRRFERWLGFAE